MKAIKRWTRVWGMMIVAAIGCGNTDDPLREAPNPPSESLVPSGLSVVGSWQLLGVTWFKNGVETQHIDFSSIPYRLTLEPDAFFDVTYRVPVKMFADQSELEWIGLEHLQNENITVTFRGRFQIIRKQLWLNLTSASASPKGAGEIDSDFEEPVFFYHLGDPGPLDYSVSDDGSRLQLKREAVTPDGDNHTVIFPHHRSKGGQNDIK